MIINAENLILGRMAAIVAKKALQGEKIELINAEKAVITGKPAEILQRYKQKFHRGYTTTGPYFQKHPDKLVRKTIRGMLPYKQEKGKKAFKNIRCHIGIPKELKGEKSETLEKANVKNIKKTKYITVKQVSQSLGWKE